MENISLIIFDSLPSTQDHAHELVDSGRIHDDTLIVAKTQTKGRGRRKHKWISKPGNLYASFVYSATVSDPRLSYAVAVAICETLEYFGMRPLIKWPNDIYIDGGKVCGILIEYHGDFVIVGIGINVKSAPKVEYKTSKTSDYSAVQLNDILKLLINKLHIWREREFETVRAEYLVRLMRDRLSYNDQPAKFCGISDDGTLVVQVGDKYQTLIRNDH